MKKDLSIIIPVGNDWRIITCLESIQKQKSNLSIEVIIVDSFCSKDLINAIKSFKANFDIILVKKYSKKIGLLRNTGLKNISSNIIYFIDSDCILEKDAIKQAYKSGIQNLVTRGYIKFQGNKSRISKLDSVLRQQRYDSDKHFAYCPNLVLQKRLFEKIGLYKENYYYGSDGEFAKRIKDSNIDSEYNSFLKLIHLAPIPDSRIIKTWIRYGEGRYKRMRNSSFKEKLKALYQPNLFDFSKSFAYNLVFFSCLCCRWYGWIKAYLKK